MIRKIIQIDEEKCNGCGACAAACHEGAIGMVNNKAKLLRDDYCDGLGDCLPTCPTGAITFVNREAAAYNEAAVKAAQQKKKETPAFSCPGTKTREFHREINSANPSLPDASLLSSQLSQWPVQIKLLPITAPYFNNANLLIAADCTAYAYGNFHNRFMKNKITLIGCPKLDNIDYSEKLTAIIRENDIKSITIVRMEVPCCRGLEIATKKAIQESGKFIPWQIAVVSTDGNIISD